MAKIGVVAVPFIRSIDEHMFMIDTIASLQANQTEHELDLIAVVNKLDDGGLSLSWLNEHFHCVLLNDENNLAKAWNKGMQLAFSRGADYCLVINLDLIFHPKFIDNLVAHARCFPEAVMWSGRAHPTQATLDQAPLAADPRPGVEFCAFMVDQRLRELVGPFDETFRPAYHEDADMAYRIGLKNLATVSTSAATYFHFESVTLQCAMMANARDVTQSICVGVARTRKLYERKWGGPPGEERFRSPFNQILL